MSTLNDRGFKRGFDVSAKADKLLKDHPIASVCVLLLSIGAAFFMSTNDSGRLGPEAVREGLVVIPILSVGGYFGLRFITLMSKLYFRAERPDRQPHE